MNRNAYIKTGQVVLLVVLVAFQLRYGLIPAWQAVQSDFPNYYTASRLVIEGKAGLGFYDNTWFQQQMARHGMDQQGKFSPFPPASAFIMLPLAAFPPLTAKRVWTIANVLLLLACIILLKKITGWDYLVSANLLLLAGPGLANNFRLGQFYLALLFLILLGYYLWRQRPVLAGALLGAGASLKYFPAVFLLVFALNKRWKVLLGGLSAMLVITLLEIAVFGLAAYRRFISAIFLPHLSGDIPGQSIHSVVFQSWESMFRNLFIYHARENPAPLLHWPPGVLVAKAVLFAIVISLTAAVFRQWQRRPLSERLPMQLALLGMAAMLLLPASATYHFLLLVFPTAILLSRLNTPALHWAKRAVWGIYVLIHFLGMFPLNAYHPPGLKIILLYPRVWLMTILFAISLWMMRAELAGRLSNLQTER